MKNKELKLLLENFQSISNGELTFTPGLNFIIGQSNSGKSATFRALKACLSNPPGSQRFIKNGTKQAVVTLKYNNNSITWKRTQKENSYSINGENYIKTGKSDVFKLVDDTGFVTDSNDVIMNIEEELQLPFPFGISKADLFKLFENVFCVSDSAIILKSAKGQEDKVKLDKETLENELLKNNKKIEELDKFKEEVNLEKLQNWKEYLLNKSNRLSVLKDGLDVIKKAVKASTINTDFKEFNTEDKYYLYVGAVKLRELINKLKKLHALNKSLPAYEGESIDISNYKELVNLSNTVNKITKLDEIKFENFSLEEKLSEYSNLVKMQQLVAQLKGLSKISFSEIELQNKLEKLNELKDFKSSLTKIQQEGKVKKAELEEVSKILRCTEEKLKEFKVCPLCHHELEGE